MKIKSRILLSILLLLLLSSAAFANPMAGPGNLIAGIYLFGYVLLLETGLVLIILRRFNLRITRFGPVWFLVNIVSFLSFVYSVDFVKPYVQVYIGTLSPFLVGEVVVIIVEGTILYFLTRFSWFRTTNSRNVPLHYAYCASLVGNVVSIIGPVLHLVPMLIITYLFVWPTLIPVILLLLLFVIFIILKKKGHIQEKVPQMAFLVIILLMSGTMIVLSLTGNYSLPIEEIRDYIKQLSFVTFNIRN